VKFKLLI